MAVPSIDSAFSISWQHMDSGTAIRQQQSSAQQPLAGSELTRDENLCSVPVIVVVLVVLGGAS